MQSLQKREPPPAVTAARAVNTGDQLGGVITPIHSLSTQTRQVAIELRHARLRLALAENMLCWAQDALLVGTIGAEGALMVLDEAMADLSGGAAS